jgi:hypothetical protein
MMGFSGETAEDWMNWGQRVCAREGSLNAGMLKYSGSWMRNGEVGLYVGEESLMETLFSYAIVDSFIGLNFG